MNICDKCIFYHPSSGHPTCNKIYETDISLQTVLNNPNDYYIDWVRGLILNANVIYANKKHIIYTIFCMDRNYNGKCKYYMDNIEDLELPNLDEEAENKKHTCINCEHCLRTMYISCDKFDKSNPYSYEYKCKLEAKLESDYINSNVKPKIIYSDCTHYNRNGDCCNWRKKIIPDYNYKFDANKLLTDIVMFILFLICAYITIYFWFFFPI